MDCGIASSLYRNQSWDNNPDLFGVKIVRDLARAFLNQTVLTISPPDFLNSSGDSNYDVGGPFRNSSSTALVRESGCQPVVLRSCFREKSYLRNNCFYRTSLACSI
jgi:hypothetical protein